MPLPSNCRYRIELNGLAYLHDPSQIADQLYMEHPLYLNDNNVEYEQVVKLVTKITQNLQRPKTAVIKNLDEVNSYIESDNDLNRSMLMENGNDLLEEDWRTPPANRRTGEA